MGNLENRKIRTSENTSLARAEASLAQIWNFGKSEKSEVRKNGNSGNWKVRKKGCPKQ